MAARKAKRSTKKSSRTSRVKGSTSKRHLKFNNRVGIAVFVSGFALLGAFLIIRSFAAVPPPPAAGYFSLVPVGQFDSLPNDVQAAAMVHRSAWEPRPENALANRTVPPSTFTTAGYAGMTNRAKVFGRVTGNFTGTTDEIIQWAAAKWGLPDNFIRAEAVQESYWYQGVKDANGNPISGKGYGDFGSCGGQGSPAPSGYGTAGPSSFGLMQSKWCALKDSSAAGYDGWPWNERSTAYNVDLYAAVMRGCFEGWDAWLVNYSPAGNPYKAGDLWGCAGRWYSGNWHDSYAEGYIATLKSHYNNKPWLGWPDLSVADTTPPTSPGTPSVSTVTSSQLSLSWAAASDNVGITGYAVYRNGVKLATVGTNSFTDTGLAAGTTYSYYVSASDAAGNISPNSYTVRVTTLATPPSPAADTTAPTVTISRPSNNAYATRTVYVAAGASDNAKVAKLQIYIDGSLRYSNTDSTIISYSWSTKRVRSGPHTITVKAYDAAGNVGNASVIVNK